MSGKYTLLDWMGDLPPKVFFWGAVAIVLGSWTLAMTIILIYLRFF